MNPAYPSSDKHLWGAWGTNRQPINDTTTKQTTNYELHTWKCNTPFFTKRSSPLTWEFVSRVSTKQELS